ncbi:hypothetical protein D3C78_848120 [compost metagenome]
MLLHGLQSGLGDIAQACPEILRALYRNQCGIPDLRAAAVLQVAPHQRRADAAPGGAARHGEVVQVQAVWTARRAEGAIQWRDLAGQGAVAEQIGAHAVGILGDPGQVGKAVQALADDRGALQQFVGVRRFLDCQYGRDVVLGHQTQAVIHGQLAGIGRWNGAGKGVAKRLSL